MIYFIYSENERKLIEMNDYIAINNLIVFANHGVFDEEKAMGQRFVISLKLYTDICDAAKSDDIRKSVNYGEVCHFVTEFTKTHRAKLIEKAAEELTYALLAEYPSLTAVETELKKPWAPIGLPLDDVLVSVKRCRKTAYIGVGSNLGDKRGYLDFAVERLGDSKYCEVRKVSTYIETEPVGGVEQDNFLNACIELETVLPPYELLALLNEIENDAGRKREIHWGPRTLDLDLLLYGDDVIATERLCVPHREMTKRKFVLCPLCEIAPYAYHPLKRKYAVELLEELNDGNA